MKILGFTSIRSDYDLMSPLYKVLNEDTDIDFKILVSGSHLSKSFGYSVEQIKNDGFEILLEIETLLNSDSSMSRVKSASLLLQNSLEIINKFKPDLMLYAGDREDVIIYAIIGGYLGIPTIHFYGGDHAIDGYIDNPIRHATSKLSTAHFVAIEEHKMRLIKMGESPERIFVVGSISLDRFRELKPLTKDELKMFFNIEKGFDEFALVIFHPITSEKDVAHIYFENILKALERINIKAFVSYPNIDPGNNNLIDIINKYRDSQNFIFYKNLDRNIFLSIYKNSKFIIGNSSSGIYEAASIKIPAINVGLRQVGRLAPKNVIFTKPELKDIEIALNKALSNDFLKSLENLENPYGDGHSTERAYKLIKEINFKSLLDKVEDPLSYLEVK